MNGETELQNLKREIDALTLGEVRPHHLTWFSFIAASEGFHVKFHGSPFETPYIRLMETVSRKPVAEKLLSLAMDGPDDGANGTQHWDLRDLADSQIDFPRLLSLSIRQTRTEDHNRAIVGDAYQENGIQAKILGNCPNLKEFTSPSAPDRRFFECGPTQVEYLNIDAGYDTQDFIANLSRSSAFPKLRSLVWGEYHETYMENWRTRATPLEDFHKLFGSPAFDSVNTFRWKNPACTDAELLEVRRKRPDVGVKIIRTATNWLDRS